MTRRASPEVAGTHTLDADEARPFTAGCLPRWRCLTCSQLPRLFLSLWVLHPIRRHYTPSERVRCPLTGVACPVPSRRPARVRLASQLPVRDVARGSEGSECLIAMPGLVLTHPRGAAAVRVATRSPAAFSHRVPKHFDIRCCCGPRCRMRLLLYVLLVWPSSPCRITPVGEWHAALGWGGVIRCCERASDRRTIRSRSTRR